MSQKNLLVLLGSPRREGNSSTLAMEAMRGASENDARVECHRLHDMNIRPCQACEYCRQDGAQTCCQADDMQILYPKLRAADSILIGCGSFRFTIMFNFANEIGKSTCAPTPYL
jgi:multimeric flavodoxin WrbA